jgi:hypothetical protein
MVCYQVQNKNHQVDKISDVALTVSYNIAVLLLLRQYWVDSRYCQMKHMECANEMQVAYSSGNMVIIINMLLRFGNKIQILFF